MKIKDLADGVGEGARRSDGRAVTNDIFKKLLREFIVICCWSSEDEKVKVSKSTVRA